MRTVPDIQTDIDQTEYQRDYLNARLSRLHSEMQDAMARENVVPADLQGLGTDVFHYHAWEKLNKDDKKP